MKALKYIIPIIPVVLLISCASPASLMSVQELQQKHEITASEARRMQDGIIWIGMTQEMVRDSWGKPTTINRTITSGGVREQWVYRRGSPGLTQYVYIRNGEVSSIQS